MRLWCRGTRNCASQWGLNLVPALRNVTSAWIWPWAQLSRARTALVGLS